MTEPPVPHRPQPHLLAGGDPHTITLTHDQVLVLFELFERMEETDGIVFEHPAELTALGAFEAQLVPLLWEVFDRDWEGFLRAARARVGSGFEGLVNGLGHVRVEADGSLTPTPPPAD